jgi:nitrogen fixation protein FixH
VTRIRLTWGTGIAAVYVVFASCTLAVVAFAISQPVDLVSADYYAQALAFDRRQAASARAGALGAKLEIAATGGSLLIRLAQPDAAGRVTLYRPSASHTDREQALDLAGGEQRIDLRTLAAGRWLVKMEWTSGGLDYYREQALVLK